jgi:hypothetical protein
MSSTRKTSRHLRLAKKLPIGEGVAVTPAADAVGDGARAVAAAEAAAGPGAVAVCARSEGLPGQYVQDGRAMCGRANHRARSGIASTGLRNPLLLSAFSQSQRLQSIGKSRIGVFRLEGSESVVDLC